MQKATIKFGRWLTLAGLTLVALQTPLIVRFVFDHNILKAGPEFLLTASLLSMTLHLILTRRFREFVCSTKGWLVLLLTFAGLNLVTGFFWPHANETWLMGLLFNLRFGLAWVNGLLISFFDDNWPTILRKFLLKLGMVVAIIACIQALVLPADFLRHLGYSEQTILPYQTIDQNHQFIRVNSTLRGPNPLGAYMVINLGLWALVVLSAKSKLSLTLRKTGWLAVVIGVALWFSYSRSAWLAAAVVIFGAWLHRPKTWRVSRRLIVGSAVAVFVVLISGTYFLTLKNHNPFEVAGRFVEHTLLHRNQEFGAETGSDEDRIRNLSAFDKILAHPLGHGVGSGTSASFSTKNPQIIENQYLQIGYELGWLGFLVFTSLLIGLIFNLWQSGMPARQIGIIGLGLTLIGLFLPVFTDAAVNLTWFSLAGAHFKLLPKN